jgi:HK97 family phage prohead protease
MEATLETNKKYERRVMEVRAVDGEGMNIEGYALKFESPATHGDGLRKFTETIKKGALDSADMRDVPLRYNHNDNVLIMARTRNKSLQLIIDDTGLLIRAALIDTQSNRDLYKSIQEQLIDKMSFAFNVSDGGDTWSFGESETTRDITKIARLWDVSVVDMPFYDSTSIYARSFDLLDNEKKQLDSAREKEILRQKIIMKGKF